MLAVHNRMGIAAKGIGLEEYSGNQRIKHTNGRGDTCMYKGVRFSGTKESTDFRPVAGHNVGNDSPKGHR
jgi:hypothetical protein